MGGEVPEIKSNTPTVVSQIWKPRSNGASQPAQEYISDLAVLHDIRIVSMNKYAMHMIFYIPNQPKSKKTNEACRSL